MSETAATPASVPSSASRARAHEVARVLRDVAATCSSCAGHVQLTDGQIACALPEGEKIPDCTLVRLAARVEDRTASCAEIDNLAQVADSVWIAQHAKTVVPLPEIAKKNDEEEEAK